MIDVKSLYEKYCVRESDGKYYCEKEYTCSYEVKRENNIEGKKYDKSYGMKNKYER